MKQKNMVLLGLAVGCGLVAAFLTSRLSAGRSGPETVELIVAKKEIKIGTLLEEKDLKDYIATAPFVKDAVPPDAVIKEDDLKGKRLSRTLRAGNYFSPSDINGNEGIPLPTGTFMYAVRMDAVRAAAGFVKPGDKVEVLALQHHPTNANLVRSRLILSDMLAVAVDINDRRAEGGGSAQPTITSVSLAVMPEQAKLLHNAESTGGELRLLLRGPTSNYAQSAIKVDDWYDFSDMNNDKRIATGGEKGPEMVQIAFAKQDVPLNQKITGDNLGDFFELRSFPAPAPATAVKDLSDLKGRFVRIPLTADLPVLNTTLADNELAPVPPTVVVKEKIVEKEVIKEVQKVGPERVVDRIVERIVEKEAPRKTVSGLTHELIIQTGGKADIYTFKGPTERTLRLVNGADANQPGGEQPKAEDKPEPEAKPEAKPETKPESDRKPAKTKDPQTT